MIDANIVLLYVTSPKASGRFYARLLGREPIEASPTFVLVPIAPNLTLGLWGREGVEPAAVASGGASEIGFKVAGAEAVDTVHAEWRAKGASIALPPTDLDFGRSFVAVDPDGHRLRVYAPHDES